MAITFRAVGTYVSGTGNITPGIPGGTVARDIMICAVGTKPYTGSNSLPAGWVSIGSATDGTVAASAADVGSMKIEFFYKIHTGTESNPLVTNATNDVSGAVIISFAPSSGYGFITPVGAGGGDATAGTGFSVTAGSDPGITAGDMLVAYAAIRSDAGTQSSISLTATSATIAAFTESPATDLATTSGFDMAMSGGYALCTAGTASAAPVYASTLAASHTGSAYIVRLREELLPTLYPKQIITSTGTGNRTCALVSCAAGARLVVSILTEDDSDVTPGDATITDNLGGGSLTWTKRVDAQSSNGGNAQIWDAVYAAGGNITITGAWNTTNKSMVAYEINGQEASPGGATNTGLNQSLPSVNITTGGANSLVICATSDFSAIDGASRAYRNGETEALYNTPGTSFYTAYHYFKIIPSAGSQTFGLTAPNMASSGNTVVYEIRLTTGTTMTAGAGTYAITGNAANLLEGKKVVAAAGTYTITGRDATLAKGTRMVADAGTYAITGNAANLLEAKKMVADAGSYAITGRDANLLEGKILTAAAGSYAITGNNANLISGRIMTAAAGAYNLTGNDAALREAKIMIAGAGAYAITGQDANLLEAKKLTAEAGTYAITGNAATLTKSNSYSLVASAGNYNITGYDVTFIRTRILTAVAGVYNITGNAATLTKSNSFTLAAGAGVYILTGNDATLIEAKRISGESGVYALTGNAAIFRTGGYMPADAGVYTLTGSDAQFIRALRLQGATGVYTLTGFPAVLTYTPTPTGIVEFYPSALWLMAPGETTLLEKTLEHINGSRYWDGEQWINI